MFISTAVGFTRGFIRDFFSTCAWFVSGFIAVFFAPYLTPAVFEQIPNITIARCAALGITYILTLVILLLIIAMVSRKVQNTSLSGIDKAVGILFGFGRGAGVLISGAALISMFEVPREKYPVIKNSKLLAISFDTIGSKRLSEMSAIMASGVKNIESIKAEKIIAEPKIKKEIKANPKEKSEKPLSEKTKKNIAQVIASKHFARKSEKSSEHKITQGLKSKRHKYGSMSLMEIRAQRHLRKKEGRIKKEIKKHLDKENL
jgi:membrane protein required for colicin V production